MHEQAGLIFDWINDSLIFHGSSPGKWHRDCSPLEELERDLGEPNIILDLGKVVRNCSPREESYNFINVFI